jgi:hypothetical protein
MFFFKNLHKLLYFFIIFCLPIVILAEDDLSVGSSLDIQGKKIVPILKNENSWFNRAIEYYAVPDSKKTKRKEKSKKKKGMSFQDRASKLRRHKKQASYSFGSKKQKENQNANKKNFFNNYK